CGARRHEHEYPPDHRADRVLRRRHRLGLAEHRPSISGHAEKTETDIAEAMRQRAVRTTAESLALHTQAVLQDAFILANAKDTATLIICAATSKTCSIRPTRKENDHEDHCRD